MRRSWHRLGQLVFDLFAAPPPTEFPPAPPSESARPSPLDAWGARGGLRHASLSSMPLVFSKRMKRSWRLEHPRSHPVLHLPHALREAPDSVWEALGDWVIAQSRPSPGSRVRAKLAAQTVFSWMGNEPERVPSGSSHGKHHDLQAIFDELNRTHFGGRLHATIRWSPRPGGLSTHRLLATTQGDRHLITIGQVYDQASVPKFALEGVVYHEILHIIHPPRKTGILKRHVHHRAFVEAERAFPGYAAWKAWEIREMPRLLRALRRQTRKK